MEAYLNQNQLVNQLVAEKSDKSEKKEEINFEKLYMSVMELKQESDKTLDIYSQFFQDYIDKNQSCNSKEIFQFLSQVEANKRIIEANINLQKKLIYERNRKRCELIDSQNNFLRNYLHISNSLNKNKRIYSENVKMNESEINSLYLSIESLNRKIESLKEEILSLDNEINQTKTENKVLCAREYDFIYQILDIEKKMYEIVSEKEKNLGTLAVCKANYSLLTEKYENMSKIKERIIASHQRKRKCVMRQVFQAKKFNEENKIEERVHQHHLILNNSRKVANFTFEEAYFFSNIFDSLKSWYMLTKEKITLLNANNQERNLTLNFETELFRKEVSECLSMISQSYQDIKIDNFTDLGISPLAKILCDVNRQISLNVEQVEAEVYEISEEIKLERQENKILSNEILNIIGESKSNRLKKKSFVLLKNFARVRISKKEKERKEHQEEKEKRERIERMKAEKEEKERLERENAERIEKERKENERKAQEKIEKEIAAEREKESLRKREKFMKENFEIEKNKERAKREKELNDLLNYDTGIKNIPEENTKELPTKRKRNNRRTTQQPPQNIKPVNTNTSNNTNSNNINNIISKYTNNSDLPAQTTNNNPRFNFKVDIPTLEESFSKNMGKNLQSNDFLNEISKNINEVAEFPVKATFGGKKKSFFNF